MADIWDKEKRSNVMAKIRSKHTKPEILLRSLLHKAGYRFRLHQKDLPGKPDIVLPRYKLAIFVNGCFWHQHKGCIDEKIPKTRSEYWAPKLQKNVERDNVAYKNLKKLGWNVVIIWECEIEKSPQISLEKVIHQLAANNKVKRNRNFTSVEICAGAGGQAIGLEEAGYQDILNIITSLWGFGTWSADMVAIFYVQLPDVWPENDVALNRGLKFLIQDDEPISIAQHYCPNRTYLARHIWKGLDSGTIYD